MKQFLFRPLLMLALIISLLDVAEAQTNTPTNTPTDTPTATPTNTPTATFVTAATATPQSTATPSNSASSQRLTSPLLSGSLTGNSGSIRLFPGLDGGDLGKINQVYAVLANENVSLGTMTNGTTETTSFISSTPVPQWTPNDSSVSVAISTDHYIWPNANSLSIAFGATASTYAGATNNISNDDWEANEGFQYCLMSSEALSAGDLALRVEDTSANTLLTLPAVPDKYIWFCSELPIGPVFTGGNGNAVDKLHIILTAQGASAHAAFTVWLTKMYKWDTDDEEALGVDSLCSPKAVKLNSVLSASGSANTVLKLAEGTDFFLVCRAGNDVVVTITDQSNYSGFGTVSVAP